MPQAVIDNPILNSPFDEPSRHFRFDEQGITNDIVETRRTSSYFTPIAQPKKKDKQLQFETEWTQDRLEENRVVNLIRQRVNAWRQGGHVGVTSVTSRLLSYWTNREREKPLFFCQVEAVETAIAMVTSLSLPGFRRHRRHVLSQKLDVAAQGFTDDVHVTARSLAFLAQLRFGREGWQNLLHPCEPAIEIFEMSRDHGIVHKPDLTEKHGGERTAILASSWRGNARAVKGPDG